MKKPREIRWILYVAFFVVLLAAPLVVVAQIPTATGRSFTLSNLGSPYKLFIPDNYVHRAGDETDLVVHFHGDPQTYWNNVAYANLNVAVVTVNLGALSGAYQTPFASDATLFGDILTEARTALRNQPDFSDTLQFDKLAVSSFSAGYAAVREILKQPAYFNDIDAMVLADTVYASFTSDANHAPLASQMTDFRSFAQAAEDGTKTLTLSHSKVLTFTYCNTIETADDLIAWVGVAPSAYNATGLGDLQFYRRAETGNFTVYGANGADGPAHLKHLQNIGQFLEDMPLSRVPEPRAAGMMLALAAPALFRSLGPRPRRTRMSAPHAARRG